MRAFKQGPVAPEQEPPDDGARIDAMRSWLSNGIHKFAVDPRRRHGRHVQARQLLADAPGSDQPASGRWQSLASALHRHTVRAGLSELSADERRVITLAYLEGRSNREIAAILGVSISTVRRRLWAALKRLEAYISGTGTWLSAIVLLGAAYVIERAARVGRWANVDLTHKLASTVAVGAVTAAAIGLTAMIPDSTSPGRSSIARTAPTIATGPIAGVLVAPTREFNPSPVQTASILTPVRSHPLPVTTIEPETGSDHPNHGCGGNPTSAPPPVPVGPHQNGSPVSHPSKGGCRV